MYKAAQVRHALGHEWSAVEAAYLAAYRARPNRLEPLFQVVKHYREAGEFDAGYDAALLAGLYAPYPNDELFIEKPVHTHEFALEYGVCAYGTGRFAEAVAAFNLVLQRQPAPPWVLQSAIRGRSMALVDLFPVATAEGDPRNHLTVIVPFHNPGDSLRC